MISFKEYIAEAGSRIRRVRVRIRNGRVQRNIRTSGVRGMKIRGGRLVRMSSMERLHRKRGARKGRIKRRAKLVRSLLKRKRSLRRRAALGV